MRTNLLTVTSYLLLKTILTNLDFYPKNTQLRCNTYDFYCSVIRRNYKTVRIRQKSCERQCCIPSTLKDKLVKFLVVLKS